MNAKDLKVGDRLYVNLQKVNENREALGTNIPKNILLITGVHSEYIRFEWLDENSNIRVGQLPAILMQIDLDNGWFIDPRNAKWDRTPIDPDLKRLLND